MDTSKDFCHEKLLTSTHLLRALTLIFLSSDRSRNSTECEEDSAFTKADVNNDGRLGQE